MEIDIVRARRKSSTAQLLSNNLSEEVAKFQLNGYVDITVIQKRFPDYSRLVIRRALKQLGYIPFRTKFFQLYYLRVYKRLSFEQISQIIKVSTADLRKQYDRFLTVYYYYEDSKCNS